MISSNFTNPAATRALFHRAQQQHHAKHGGDQVQLRGGHDREDYHQTLARFRDQLQAREDLGLVPNAELGKIFEEILADKTPTEDLKRIADRKMAEAGLAPAFTGAVLDQAAAIKGPAMPGPNDSHIRDLRHVLMTSIDNGTLNPETRELEHASMDIDQLSAGEKLPDGRIRIYVAIADVDSLVKQGDALDQAAAHNTSTVYTDDKIYPMIPPNISEGHTSLNPGEDRLAMVKEYVVGLNGEIEEGAVYQALVHNHGKMAYDSVADWMGEQKGPTPPPLEDPAIAEQVRVQDEAAQRIKAARFGNGSITLESSETRATVENGEVKELEKHRQNRAHELIENLMIGANQVTARSLAERGYPSLRRIVKTPEKWDHIVELAKTLGHDLPSSPDSKALNEFLEAQKAADPAHFQDLSLKVVKYIGRGEYVVDSPEEPAVGHFCLALSDYSHSTAPNRRYADLVLQRIEKAAALGQPCPYTLDELTEIAAHLTKQEGEIKKVERKVNHSAQAKLMKAHIGESFSGVVQQATAQGTFVRLPDPPVQGKVVNGSNGLEERQDVEVTLKSVNVEKGWIDFVVDDNNHGGFLTAG